MTISDGRLVHVHSYTHSDFAFNSDCKLLVEPYLDCRMLLQKFEYKVDWWEKDLASTAAASIHDGSVQMEHKCDCRGIIDVAWLRAAHK